MLLGVARDATGLVESNQRFRVAIEALPAPVLMVDERWRVELVNMEAERLFGYPSGSLIGRPIESMIPGSLASVPATRDVTEVFSTKGTGAESGAIRRLNAVRSNGRSFPVELRLNPVYFGGGNHWLAVVIDVDARTDASQAELTRKLEDANRKLSRLAITDELTDTLNRRAFDAELRKSLRLFSRLGQALSLIMLDIDHFKLYNDRYGHPAGDDALRAVARLLCQSARDTDVVARYGGEEFAIVLPNTDESAAVQIAERLKARIDQHPWRRERLTVSMGAATIPPGSWGRDSREDSGVQLVREADQALYFSKNNGKDRVTHFFELELPATN
jgi:diguanylate cyclase (GGDEF)-like protein/PAS domain S-box-containing protein